MKPSLWRTAQVRRGSDRWDVESIEKICDPHDGEPAPIRYVFCDTMEGTRARFVCAMLNLFQVDPRALMDFDKNGDSTSGLTYRMNNPHCIATLLGSRDSALLALQEKDPLDRMS